MATPEEFEEALKAELPRGHDLERHVVGSTRGLFARWLQPEELTGGEARIKNQVRNDQRHTLTGAAARDGEQMAVIGSSRRPGRRDGRVSNRYQVKRRGAGVTGKNDDGLNQNVCVLDPFGVSGIPTSSFNPLAEIKLTSDDAIEDVTTLADALIVAPEGGDIKVNTSSVRSVEGITFRRSHMSEWCAT